MYENETPATARFVRIVAPEESGLDVPTELWATARPRWIGTDFGAGVGVINVLLAKVERGTPIFALIAATSNGLPCREGGLTFLNDWCDSREAAFATANIQPEEPS